MNFSDKNKINDIAVVDTFR